MTDTEKDILLELIVKELRLTNNLIKQNEKDIDYYFTIEVGGKAVKNIRLELKRLHDRTTILLSIGKTLQS